MARMLIVGLIVPKSCGEKYTLLTAQIMLAALQPALGPGHLQHPGFEGSGSKHLHRQFKNLSIRRGKSGLKQ